MTNSRSLQYLPLPPVCIRGLRLEWFHPLPTVAFRLLLLPLAARVS